MRTLQACLDLNDDGDKVIFRQFGGESSLRTLQSGHTRTFVPTNLIPMVGSSQKSRAHVYRRPRRMDNDTSAGDHEPASTRSCRPRQKTTSNDNGPARSHPTIFPTSSLRFKSGKETHGTFQNHERELWTSSQRYQSRRDSTAWNTVDDQTVETTRTLHGVRVMRGILRHLSREFLMLIPVGRSEDIQLALRRREQREMKDKKSNVANLLEAQWVRGKALPRGNRGTCGRRRRTIAIIHRLRSRTEATL